MERPCVVVAREDGEATRQRLAEADLIDEEFGIEVSDGDLHIPVTDPDAVPEDLDLVRRDVPARTPQRTPADLLGDEPTYERLGDVVLVDEDDPERATEIAEAVVASDIPVRSVLNRDSKVKGETRVRDWKVLADEGEEDQPPTETVHREYGHEFAVDVAEVYFSPRLATERHRVVEQVEPGEHVLDMFAGVGPYAIPMADAGAEVVACDLNPDAIRYLEENARRNGVEDRITTHVGDVRELTEEYADWADRLVMNLPHTAAEFADAAVAFAGDSCVVHLYDIQHEDDPFERGRTALSDAAGDEYEVTTLEERVVRSYAPHEVNVCLDARLDRID
ncbi:class I SAM-dependent methyltransferase family protein [Halolamina sp. CBA1230]|uniref:class I SAM-dependent methyltransferase n=1 Tax=Halolamina sp. CBA1230 TaxID=1853690 RepID=UPI0009A15361|nr:class I SAM-dependent methyltransferase family protein [Halolamina sp. CBA1230]QKY18922.1 class I SAM-dependent methyltransferase family protein [Halolamina sp. CBA1230]